MMVAMNCPMCGSKMVVHSQPQTDPMDGFESAGEWMSAVIIVSEGGPSDPRLRPIEFYCDHSEKENYPGELYGEPITIVPGEQA